jgi:hypothetical protein
VDVLRDFASTVTVATEPQARGSAVAAVRAGVSAAFAAASGILFTSGVAAWVGAAVAGVGTVVQWLVGFMNDDHLADSTIVFDGPLPAKQLPSAGSTMITQRRFADGDADYTINLTSTRIT